MIFGLKRRLNKIRRVVENPDEPGTCAVWVCARVLEPFGPPPKVAIVAHFSGGKEAELGRDYSLVRAVVAAERNVQKQRLAQIQRPQLVDVTPFIYQSHLSSKGDSA